MDISHRERRACLSVSGLCRPTMCILKTASRLAEDREVKRASSNLNSGLRNGLRALNGL